MDVRIGPFLASVSRDRSPHMSGQTVTQSELDRLLSYWAPLPKEAHPDLLSKVVVTSIASREGLRAAKDALTRHGIVIVPNFYDREDALVAGNRALAIAEEVGDGSLANGQPEGYVVEVDSPRGYYDLAGEAFATANLRLGADRGLLDIFNFDALDEGTGSRLRTALSSRHVMDLVPTPEGKAWRPWNLNVYVNRGVTHTRMFHVDSYGGGQVKAFLYLTDVNSTDDGPYSYVLDSHKAGAYRDLNLAVTRAHRVFKPTDAPLVDPAKILPVIAPAGSLVVSDQSGFHRGFPQLTGHKRAVAVLNIVAGKG